MAKPADDVVRVDFRFKRELAAKIEGNLASFCYQCGACVGDCPSAAYGDRFNPREIMLSVLYGLGDELLGGDSVLWQCTNCYTCHERCPQQVKPVEVIISLKNMLADRGLAPEPVSRVIAAFESTGRTTPVNAAVERQRERFGLPALHPVSADELAAVIAPLARGDDAVVKVVPPHRPEPVPAPSGSRFAFFPGCLIPTRYPAMEAAIRSSLPRLGIELVDIPGASCCPDPIYFKSKDKLAWLAVAARNLALAEELGEDVCTNCSGCTATLSESFHLLENADLREQINRRLRRVGREYRGTSRVRHIATLVRDVAGIDAVRASIRRPLTGLRVAIHYGCHLLKPSSIMQVDDPNDPSMLESLVAALGATPVRHRNWSLCCGKACQDEDIPATMMRDLLRTVQDEQADLLCLICPTCFGQFDHGQVRVGQRFGETFDTPAVYYFQLLAFAQGTPFAELGFERQRLKPEVLLRFEASPDTAAAVPDGKE